MLKKQTHHKTWKKSLMNHTVPIEKAQDYYNELEKEYGKHKNPFSELTDDTKREFKKVRVLEEEENLASVKSHTPLVAYLKMKFSPYVN